MMSVHSFEHIMLFYSLLLKNNRYLGFHPQRNVYSVFFWPHHYNDYGMLEKAMVDTKVINMVPLYQNIKYINI